MLRIQCSTSRCQHIFIDPSQPNTASGMAYNCLACLDNAITFNDGYHIQHHLNSKTHWSELPSRFLASIEEHRHEGGEGIVVLYCSPVR